MNVFIAQQGDGYETNGRPKVFADRAQAEQWIVTDLRAQYIMDNNRYLQTWGVDDELQVPKVRAFVITDKFVSYSLADVHTGWQLTTTELIDEPNNPSVDAALEAGLQHPHVEYHGDYGSYEVANMQHHWDHSEPRTVEVPTIEAMVDNLDHNDRWLRTQIKHESIGVRDEMKWDPHRKAGRRAKLKKVRAIRKGERQSFRQEVAAELHAMGF